MTLFLIASIALLAPRIGTEFLPSMDEGQFQVYVKMPRGAGFRRRRSRRSP